MTSYTDVSGVQYAYQFDGMGRATNLEGQCAPGGQCYQQVYATASYGAANQILSLSYTPTYGNGNGGNYVNETRQYNSLLQLTNITATGGYSMNMTYNYPTYNNGRISSSVDAVNSQTVNYAYDSLNRLTSAQTTSSAWGESYSYDGFGNLTGITGTGSGEYWSGSVDPTTNRLMGVNYDANGNQTGDQVYTNYVWNVENRMVQQLTAGGGGAWYGGTGYSYDPSGRRVMKNVNADPAGTNTGDAWSGTWEFYFYGLNGRKMATIDCTYTYGTFGPWADLAGCQVTGTNAYFAGKTIVENGWSVVTDRLGSARGDGGLNAGNIQYYPYGAEQSATQEGLTKFATYTRDAAGQDYAEQRYYNAGMGRFWSPDPGGIKTADPKTPLSWNRYAYTYGDPVNFMDRHGVEVEAPDEGDCDPNLDCNTPECYDPSNEFLGMPDPGCPTGGGGGPSDPTSAPAPLPPCQDWGCMPAALAQALTDLQNPDCAAVFAGGIAKGDNPSTVLEQIVAGTKYASVTFVSLSPLVGAVTAESGFWKFKKATIEINTYNNPSVGVYWNAGNAQVNALTLLHELGHIFNFLFGNGSSTIVNDVLKNGNPNPTAEAANAAALAPCNQ
jgi:RHS repeat-associated protein